MSLIPLLGLAGLAGLLAAWLSVHLLVFPAGRRPGRLPWKLHGFVNAGAADLAAYSSEHLLAALPSPSRFFEQLGPDRFRREIFRNLNARTDDHVDDVMVRRNARVWQSLSEYARNRVYAHVHRRLPYVVDNFVEHVQRDLDDIVNLRILVNRYFAESPESAGRIFLAAYGADLRGRLPLAGLLGALVGWFLAGVVAGPWQLAWVTGAAALAGSLLVLASLAFPAQAINFWPLRAEGILQRRRRRFLRILAGRIANEALAWPVLTGEFLHGAQAAKVKLLMRREVGSILDTTVFKATLQVLIGPEAVVEVKQSAIEKAMDVLANTPVSAALQESCRIEIERSLLFAADRDTGDGYNHLWAGVLRNAWKTLPPLLALAGFGLGALASWLYVLY